MIEVNIPCAYCEEISQFEVDTNDLKAWKEGMLIQTAFPYLSDSQREMLMTRTCEKCWDKLWKE